MCDIVEVFHAADGGGKERLVFILKPQQCVVALSSPQYSNTLQQQQLYE